jgi:DNA-binding transcriptional MerR regulator
VQIRSQVPGNARKRRKTQQYARDFVPVVGRQKTERVSGIRTNAAAEILGVSPNTLRSWERRFGYPRPRRTSGNHRQYDLIELETLREALRETGDISSAVQIARRRGDGIDSVEQLLLAFDEFAETVADRAMEESMALRPVERTIEELLLPAIDQAAQHAEKAAEYEFACRWATGWLHAARRVASAATRSQGVLLLDSSPRLDAETLHTQALELVLRRAGFRVLLLSTDLAEERLQRAMRALEPSALVLCGPAANLDIAGRLLQRIRRLGFIAPVFGYRSARLMVGSDGIPSLGASPSEATAGLDARLAGRTAPA